MEQDVSELLDAIIWGRRIVEVQNSDGEEVAFVFRPLTLEERNMGNYVYKKARERAIRRGIKTREDLTTQAIDHGHWRASYENDLKLLRKALEEETKALKEEEREKMLDSQGRPKRQSPTAKYKRLQKKVEHLITTVRKLEEEQTSLIELPSAEYHAECERGDYLLSCAVLTFPDMKQMWRGLADLKNEQDTNLVMRLMREFYRESVVSETDIRKVARSGFWRCKWNGSRKNMGVRTLFGRDMYDLTLDQFRLVYWSQVYDSAFESLEAPSDDVIENDKLFDKWLEEQHEKRKQERKQSAFDRKHKHLKDDAQEVGINVQGEFCEECNCGVLAEAKARGTERLGHIHAPSCPYGVFLYYGKDTKAKKVEDVQSSNPQNIRKLLAKEQERLARLGADGVEEQHLRGDKARTALGLGTKVHGPGEYGKANQGRARPQ